MDDIELKFPLEDLEQFCISSYKTWPILGNLDLIGAKFDTTVENDNPDVAAISPLESGNMDSGQFGPCILRFSWGLQIDVWGTPDQELIYSALELPKEQYSFDFGRIKIWYRIHELHSLSEYLHLAEVEVEQA